MTHHHPNSRQSLHSLPSPPLLLLVFNKTPRLWNIYENYTASIVISGVFLINLFSIRTTGFHRREKLFKLNFCIGKIFL